MKRILSLLTIFNLSTSWITSVVACNKEKFLGDIWVVMNDGYHDDQSFTEYVYRGADEFVKKIMDKSDYNAAYKELGEIGEASLRSAYENVVGGGAKVLVLSGYSHDAIAKGYFDEVIKKVNGSAVIVDNKTYKNWTSTVGVQYRADISGFYAGMASIIWSIINDNYNLNNKTLGLATFGGLLPGNQNSVINYMAGFLSAIDVWNIIKENQNNKYHEYKNKLVNLDKYGKLKDWLDNNEFKVLRTQKDPSGDGDFGWQSGSYTAGDGKDISNILINQGANILMPVAGPQTEDALAILKNDSSKKAKVVGVDVDMSKVYRSYDKLILTSAIKQLTEGGLIALAHTDIYKDNIEYQDKAAQYAKDNNIEVILKDENKQNFENKKVNFDKEKGKSWQTKTAWLSGEATSGESNLVEDYINNAIIEMFSKDSLIVMSNYYYEHTMKENPKLSFELLKASFTKEMALKVFQN
ncbi:hypothetical protein [Spiroplasma tabanidicola]|uniref:Ribose/galactose ABC transporter substrate-binding protein n=1 Tax=Spiroplasma tabanidicola TaxID=324079 RepID=A0A6I6C7P0_9MOLU|nr:hypothetical protein [Spiroplasma tabanidicola]QGS51806.1 ribose/galactose ABC transporter substrate-binding protein [Spiroplasma tabanidicola]